MSISEIRRVRHIGEIATVAVGRKGRLSDFEANRKTCRNSRKFKSALSGFWSRLRDESGSASVEFVLWVIPLFMPLIILIGQVSEIGSARVESMQLARTAIRAFSSAPNTLMGHTRIKQVLALGGGDSFNYRVECKLVPCIQPGNRIRLTLIDKSRGVEVVAVKGIGRWIEGEGGFVPEDGISTESPDLSLIEDSLEWLEQVSDAIDMVRN